MDNEEVTGGTPIEHGEVIGVTTVKFTTVTGTASGPSGDVIGPISKI